MRTSHKTSPLSAGALVALAVLIVALLAPSVAFAASGDLLWARGVELGLADEEFVDLAKGPNGTVYAVGRANYDAGAGDLLIAKFSAAGKLLWRRAFDGAAHGDDRAYAVAVDSSGNAYVTGASMSASDGMDAITLKYSSAGTRRWAKRYNGMADEFDSGNDVGLDGDGRAYVAMTSTVMGGENIVVVKYGLSGSKVWEAMWAGPGEDDIAEAIAVDQKGRAYVVGTVETFTQGSDSVIMRLTTTGGIKWSRMYNAPDSLDDAGRKVMLRGLSVYLMGVSWRAGGRWCFLAAKYARDGGTLKWARISDITGGVVMAEGLWVDVAGNVTVSGQLTVTGPEDARGAIVSWNKNGVHRWQKTYFRTATDEGAGFAGMTGSDAGVLYCVGWARRSTASDSLVVKYRSDGSRAWVRRFNSDPYEDAETSCALLTGGTSGGLYVGGALSGGGDSYSALLLKYRP
jgi:hypothetical protein